MTKSQFVMEQITIFHGRIIISHGKKHNFSWKKHKSFLEKSLFFIEQSQFFHGKKQHFSWFNSGKQTNNYGTSPFLMGKSTNYMVVFNSKLLVYQRVYQEHEQQKPVTKISPQKSETKTNGKNQKTKNISKKKPTATIVTKAIASFRS